MRWILMVARRRGRPSLQAAATNVLVSVSGAVLLLASCAECRGGCLERRNESQILPGERWQATRRARRPTARNRRGGGSEPFGRHRLLSVTHRRLPATC